MAYFKYFPIVNYNDQQMVNIMTRSKINENVKNFQSAYYPYEIKEGERLEHIAYNYYDDPTFDWLIYLLNDIIDPFYGTYLSNENFEKFILKKYGSIAKAKNKVTHYVSDWSDDIQVLTTAAYDALASGQKKYWDPILNINGVISSYERKKKYFYASTNKIESVDFATETSNTFIVGERVTRNDDPTSISVVTWANTTHYIYKHVIGTFSSNANYTVTGENSKVTATINADSRAVLYTVIPAAEQVYYSPSYAYDVEATINESKKNINLIDKIYASKLTKDLKTIMNR